MVDSVDKIAQLNKMEMALSCKGLGCRQAAMDTWLPEAAVETCQDPGDVVAGRQLWRL